MRECFVKIFFGVIVVLNLATDPAIAKKSKKCSSKLAKPVKRALHLEELYERPSLHRKLKKEKKHYIYERFLPWLGDLQSHLTARDQIDETVDYLLGHDTRGIAFRLQALCRIYRKVYRDSQFDAARDLTKELEDTIGRYIAWEEFMQFAQSVQATRAYPMLQAKLDRTRKDLRKLIANKWTPNDQGQIESVAFLMALFRRSELLSNKADQKALLKFLRGQLRKDELKVRDMTDVDQVHELRRNLRWYAIYIVSMDGTIQLTKDKGNSNVKAYNKLLKDPKINKSKYVPQKYRLDHTPIVWLSRPYFLALNVAIEQLGQFKDYGEGIKYVARAMHEEAPIESPISYDDAEEYVTQRVQESGITQINVADRAQEVLSGIVDNQLWRRVRKDFE